METKTVHINKSMIDFLKDINGDSNSLVFSVVNTDDGVKLMLTMFKFALKSYILSDNSLDSEKKLALCTKVDETVNSHGNDLAYIEELRKSNTISF